MNLGGECGVASMLAAMIRPTATAARAVNRHGRPRRHTPIYAYICRTTHMHIYTHSHVIFHVIYTQPSWRHEG
eukprot:6213453-Pleurochrysis_carterae.AAC.8